MLSKSYKTEIKTRALIEVMNRATQRGLNLALLSAVNIARDDIS